MQCNSASTIWKTQHCENYSTIPHFLVFCLKNWVQEFTETWKQTWKSSVEGFNSMGRLSTRYRDVFMGIFEHPSGRAFVRSDTGVGQDGLAHSLCSNSPQRSSKWVEVRTLCSPHLALYTVMQSCWIRKGPSPKLFLVCWSVKSSFQWK